MPLKEGKSSKTISSNIKEMLTHPGPVFKKRIAKYGKAEAAKQAEAAAYRKAGKSRPSQVRKKAGSQSSTAVARAGSQRSKPKTKSHPKPKRTPMTSHEYAKAASHASANKKRRKRGIGRS